MIVSRSALPEPKSAYLQKIASSRPSGHGRSDKRARPRAARAQPHGHERAEYITGAAFALRALIRERRRAASGACRVRTSRRHAAEAVRGYHRRPQGVLADCALKVYVIEDRGCVVKHPGGRTRHAPVAHEVVGSVVSRLDRLVVFRIHVAVPGHARPRDPAARRTERVFDARVMLYSGAITADRTVASARAVHYDRCVNVSQIAALASEGVVGRLHPISAALRHSLPREAGRKEHDRRACEEGAGRPCDQVPHGCTSLATSMPRFSICTCSSSLPMP